MNIAGVMVSALPGQMDEVEAQLLNIPGVEVHAANEAGRMVVTVEGVDERMVSDTVTEMHSLKGVLAAAMVYHSFEEFTDEEVLQ